MKKQFIYGALLVYGCLITIVACKKDAKVPENPFDDVNLQAPAAPTSTYNPAATSFEYIYEKVFNKTCNNSGCHDGTFPPDFRNLSSAYNSIVYAPFIQTPTVGVYNYIVNPGSSATSQLVYRLTQYPGNSSIPNKPTLGQGRMPWNDTMWRFVPQNATYIQNIKDWIDAGAKDVFGNSPTKGDKNPNTLGLQLCNTGSGTALTRVNYITISKNNPPVDVWAYVVDDNTAPENMISADIRFSTNRFDFSAATPQPMTYVANGNTYKDITLTDDVKYNYKLTNFNLQTILNDTGYIFMRTFIQDTAPTHTVPAQTPNNGSMYYYNYFIIKLTL